LGPRVFIVCVSDPLPSEGVERYILVRIGTVFSAAFLLFAMSSLV
jgi:hypothetical protein